MTPQEYFEGLDKEREEERREQERRRSLPDCSLPGCVYRVTSEEGKFRCNRQAACPGIGIELGWRGLPNLNRECKFPALSCRDKRIEEVDGELGRFVCAQFVSYENGQHVYHCPYEEEEVKK